MKFVDEIVIDANMDLQWPHRMSLMPPSSTYNALIALDPANDDESLGVDAKTLVDDGEALHRLKKH